jgi:hypothetical protein
MRTSIYNTHDPLADPALHPYLCGNGMATDHCYDCAAARVIAQEYIRKARGDTQGIQQEALKLLDDLTMQTASMQLSCKAECE